MFSGKAKMLFLGGYPTVSPKEARKKSFNARKLLSEDNWTHHRKEKRGK